MVRYLAGLFAVFLFCGILFVFFNRIYFLLGMFSLFLFVSLPLTLWFKHAARTINGLNDAVLDLEKGNWNTGLPSSKIQEFQSLISSFDLLRTSFREKFLNLEGEKEKLIQILSNLKEGILVADPDNRIVMANETAANYLDMKLPVLLEKSLDFFLSGEFKPVFEPLIRFEEQSNFVTVSHSQRIFFFHSFCWKNSEGNLAAKGVVLRDVTESKKLEDVRKSFVANASHELRSPVAGLQALFDAFLAGALDYPEQRKKFIALMGREVSRLNAIIRDLLDLSELEREKEFVREPLKIVVLFYEWLKSYESRIMEQELNLVTRFENEEIIFHGSSRDMEILFRNLFENALKYTPSGGFIEVGLKRTNGALQGWVKDTGIGIPKEHLPRLFERFYRVDKSRSRAHGGTGLGLSIVKHAVERHGGKVWVESKENEGSTFYYSLPLMS